ncbi:MerR family transcriptional regulator [Pseudonocardia sp. GCM10023141]|uniref:DNA polymerase III subunit beta family protein n=1 Tax=Pseudonocardia sp. GCM10023141 TaxID=3252653 RepID=UPI0036149AB1
MERELRGIGTMSRESGLTVSALRFYDGAGLLSPAFVDPDSGYRWYAPDQLAVAKLVVVLRRAGMALAGIREVLAHRHDAAAVDALLAAHLRRLEHGLDDARRALSTVASLIEPREHPVPTDLPTTCAVDAAELAAAVRAVRFAAAGSAADPPVLGAVLFDVDPGAGILTVVATDRYRLAVADAAITVDGPAVRAVVPLSLVDAVVAVLGAGGPAELVIDGGAISVRVGTARIDGEPLPDAFPDYRRLLPSGRTGVPVDAVALRAAVAAGPARTMTREPDAVEFAVTVLGLDADGGIGVAEDGVGVNREFLLEAVDAGGDGQLVLELDGPLAPLAIRSARSVSLLMPVRL